MRVGVYARVSTSDRDQNPETQLLPLREFVREQGWDLVGEFVDKASATDQRRRTAWRNLLDEAAKRKIDVILVWKLDRAARSTYDAAATLQNLRQWGVGFRSYSEPLIDTTSPQGAFLFGLMAVFAEFELATIKERVKAGLDRARKQGKRFGRPRAINGEWAAVQPLLATRQITQAEAARRLKVSRATVGRMLKTGVVLPSMTPSGK